VIKALDALGAVSNEGPGRLAKYGPFLIGMGLYAALFSFWMTWSKHHSLVEALCNSFGSTDAFRKMVEARLRANHDLPPRAQSLYSDVREVVDRAQDNGWVDGLIVNARRSRPEDVRLAQIADRYGLGIALPATDNLDKAISLAGASAKSDGDTKSEKLETIIRQFSELSPPDRRMLEARLEARICRIITPRNEGTGWLVGPDLVLTNYHVVKEMVTETPTVRGRDVICQFDYKVASGSILKGTDCRLNPDMPVVDWSPYSAVDLSDADDLPGENELDFALLRLDRKIGDLAIGGEGEEGAPKRGWIQLGKSLDTPDPEDKPGDTKILLYVLQHPYGGPLKAECGALISVNANRTRIRHEATTERGSSGSPCFNFSNLEPFALHHAGKHSRTLNKPYNQAVPISRIMRYLRERGKVEAFWELSPRGAEKQFVKTAPR
jgi:Trypsin-like peptidase domain/Effector-associated domain 1